MALIEPIKIHGLAEFNRNLRKLDKDAPKAIRIAANEAAQIVVNWAQPKVAKKSGKAAKSIKAKSTRTSARVTGGGPKVPYYPWLDFGGSVGRKRSIKRAFIEGGRYIYPGYAANRDAVQTALVQALIQVANDADLKVTGQ